jgi:hypothetical protein
MDRETLFLFKKCRLEKKPDHFVLIGVVKEIDRYGILFKTDQKTSFINWDQIYSLVPMEDKQ